MRGERDGAATRRGFLGLLAGTGLAGCAETLVPTRTYQPPGTVRTRPGDRMATPAASPPDGEFRRVYEAAAPSVAVVRAGRGQGSAWAFDDVHLVTNQHVVGDADRIQLHLARDDWTTGEVVGTDVYSDLAVVAAPDRPDYVDPLGLVGYAPAVGQEVLAVGTPFGLQGTLTTGVISGVDRVLQATTGFSVPGAVQTDAAVNPGNSGGPLLSTAGEVVAVVSAGGGENIAFGIPPQLTRRVVPDLIEYGDYQHPFLGITLEEVDPALARANGLARPQGVLVVGVIGNGPSDGVLRPSTDEATVGGRDVPVGGDVIRGIGVGSVERPVSSTEELLTYLSFHTYPGDDLAVRVLREGEERTVTVTVGVRPGP